MKEKHNGIRYAKCKDCKFGNDGIPECYVDGACPLNTGKKKDATD